MIARINRRETIALLDGAVGWPLAALGQQPGRIRRVGVLWGFSENDPRGERLLSVVRQELEKLGWTVGRNLQIEVRSVTGDADRARAGAAEMLRLAPDVILVAFSGPALAALQQATRAIPIVFEGITGFANLEPTLGAKWLQLLKEIAPDIKRVAFLFNTETVPFNVAFSRSAAAAVTKVDVAVDQTPVHELAEIEAVMTRLAREPGGGLIFPGDTFIGALRQPIVEMAVRYQLPAIYPNRLYPEDGGLLSYGSDPLDMYRRSATYVDRILRGDKPADLPVQQPVKFELVINMKTARALGLRVPTTLLTIADEVIE
jgi:putative ABC transport system substrate-binding protein